MGRNEYTYKPGYNGTLQERMDSKTNKLSLNDCWIWTGALDSAGYATIRVDGRLRRASHIALELKLGNIPKDKIVMHKCDNPKCVNPEHLEIGTTLLNSNDKIQKNRGKWLKGENHPGAKLTSKQVDELREIYATRKISYPALGKIYGIHASTARRIVNHVIWN